MSSVRQSPCPLPKLFHGHLMGVHWVHLGPRNTPSSKLNMELLSGTVQFLFIFTHFLRIFQKMPPIPRPFISDPINTKSSLYLPPKWWRWIEHKIRSTVIIAEAELDHFGEYKCRVSNEIGQSEATIRLVEKGRPSLILNCKHHFCEYFNLNPLNDATPGLIREETLKWNWLYDCKN